MTKDNLDIEQMSDFLLVAAQECVKARTRFDKVVDDCKRTWINKNRHKIEPHPKAQI